jgi:hypothetical protein
MAVSPNAIAYYYCNRIPSAEEIVDLKFTLYYRGPIGSNKLEHKHAIRRVFHEQLKELWEQHRGLAFLSDPSHRHRHKKEPQISSNNLYGSAYNWLYLIGEAHGISCSLDITFLRRGSPGRIIRHGGDLDNKLKTLIDALKVPTHMEEHPKTPAKDDENPYFCVMQDDQYIDSIKIKSGRLLAPSASSPEDRPDDVIVLIEVATAVFDNQKADWWQLADH